MNLTIFNKTYFFADMLIGCVSSLRGCGIWLNREMETHTVDVTSSSINSIEKASWEEKVREMPTAIIICCVFTGEITSRISC